MSTEKVAFVFSGGGSKGSIQVGMAKRLYSKGILPDIVTGVSIGSFNGYFVAQDKIEELENLWRSIKGNDDVYRKRWLAGCLMYCGLQFGYPSLYKPGPLGETFRKMVKQRKQWEFRAKFRVGAVDLITGDYVSADAQHPALERILAGSAAVPLAFPPVKVKARFSPDYNGLYVDGCVRNLTPLAEAIHMGANKVHVFLTSSSVLPKTNTRFGKWSDIVDRTIDIALNEILKRDIDNVLVRNRLYDLEMQVHGKSKYRHVELFVYDPEDAKLQNVLDFDPKAIGEAIDLGYELADHPKSNGDLDAMLSSKDIRQQVVALS